MTVHAERDGADDLRDFKAWPPSVALRFGMWLRLPVASWANEVCDERGYTSAGRWPLSAARSGPDTQTSSEYPGAHGCARRELSLIHI